MVNYIYSYLDARGLMYTVSCGYPQEIKIDPILTTKPQLTPHMPFVNSQEERNLQLANEYLPKGYKIVKDENEK